VGWALQRTGRQIRCGGASKKIAGRETGYQQDLCPKIPEITITITLF
jgi:hypothetical protein